MNTEGNNKNERRITLELVQQRCFELEAPRMGNVVLPLYLVAEKCRTILLEMSGRVSEFGE